LELTEVEALGGVALSEPAGRGPRGRAGVGWGAGETHGCGTAPRQGGSAAVERA